MRNLTLFLGLISLFCACSGLRKEKVDLIVHNATIYTVNETFEQKEAIAIANDTIVAIGAEHEILNRFQSKRIIDARQQFVYPGFIDAHCHFTGYAEGLLRLNLVGTKSWEECIQRLKEYQSIHPDMQWLVGRGWDQNDWENANFPNKTALDELFPNTPVLLRRIDGHAAVANEAALAAAGINVNSSIEGGAFIIEDGQLTGVLIDRAVDLVIKKIPPTTSEQKKASLQQAESNCFKAGITSLVDAGLKRPAIELLNTLYSNNELNIRQYVMLADDQLTLEYYLPNGIIKMPSLHIRSVKTYVDGALGSRGAALLEPYSDSPTESGFLLYASTHFDSLAKVVHEAGFQLNAHCIGDSANRYALNLYGKILGGTNDDRWRIEHAQVVHPDDIAKYRAFNIIPSVQPTHATSDMYWAEERLGSERIHSAYAFKTLKDQNGMIALGTDFPVEDIDPLKTFYASVFRVDDQLYPTGGFLPEQQLSRESALKGMTIWAAIAQFEEEEKGSLEIGKLGDLVILNRDLMKINAEDFHQVEVVTTVVGDSVVYEK
jgi:predicted amidohydrolase YtcJ